MNVDLEYVRTLRARAARAEHISIDDLQSVAALLESVTIDCVKETDETLRLLSTIIQLVSNCSVTDSELRQDAWRIFYPQSILRVSRIRNDKVLDPLSYALWKFRTEGLWNLEQECDFSILGNLISFYGSNENLNCSITFSLLLGSVLREHHLLIHDPRFPDIFEAIARSDIESFNQEDTVPSIIPFMFEETNRKQSLSSLSALKACLTVTNDDDDDTLNTITSWAVQQMASDTGWVAVQDGCKACIVAMLANLVHCNSKRQRIVLEMDGMELVLNHIKLDDMNPFIREWAILFVRNMCKGNMEAQSIIAGLEFKEVLSDGADGLTAEVDSVSGKVKITNK